MLDNIIVVLRHETLTIASTYRQCYYGIPPIGTQLSRIDNNTSQEIKLDSILLPIKQYMLHYDVVKSFSKMITSQKLVTGSNCESW